MLGAVQNVPPQPNNVGGPGGLFENLVGPGDPRFEAQFSFFWFAYLGCNADGLPEYGENCVP